MAVPPVARLGHAGCPLFESATGIPYTRLRFSRGQEPEVSPITFPESYADFIRQSPTFALGFTYSFATFIRETGDLQRQWQSRYGEIRFEPEDQAFFLRFPATRYVFLQMSPHDPVAQAYAPALAAICDLNANLDLRIVPAESRYLPVLQTLTGSADGAGKKPCHAYLFNEDWQLTADWSPLRNELSRVPKLALHRYGTLRLQLNSRRNQPIVQGVRLQLEASLPDEVESPDESEATS